jgi:hypothetical protein
VLAKLKEWSLDWLGRADVRPPDRKIDDPLTLLQRVFAALAGIVAILSSPAISLLTPNLNPNASLVLRVVIALVTLVAVNYVVTAKDTVETTSGFRSQMLRTYRFTTAERMIARGVVAVALLLLALNLVPPTPAARPCNLTATADWESGGSTRPLLLSLVAGGRTERFAVEKAMPVAIQLPLAHAVGFSIVLEWSDNTRSDFGAFSGCAAVTDRRSGDGRAKIDLAVR